jgi:hypothetical protein
MSEKNASPTFRYEPDASAGSFVALLAQEETPTVDGRMFTAGAISWRELPIPLALQRLNKAEGQHKEAIGIGAISEVWRDGNAIYGRGYFSSDEEGQNARKLIGEGMISTVSADVGGVRHAELAADDIPEGVNRVFTRGTILGVTALLHSSFNETRIAVETPDDAVTAAANGHEFDAAMFANPNLKAPTPLTITDEGRVYGHAAIFGTCHVGYRDRCVTPPRSQSNYAYFATGLAAAAGSDEPVRVGVITANTGHAPIELAAQPARAHYDNTGFAAAFVAAGEDEFGIWFSGVVAPSATPEQVTTLRAAGVSGDWRKINNNLELVGILSVNTPGFPVPRPTAGLVAGAEFSLIAAGMVEEFEWSVEELAAKKKGACCSACADAHDDDEEELTVEESIEGVEIKVEEEAAPAEEVEVETKETEEALAAKLALMDLDVSFSPFKRF